MATADWRTGESLSLRLARRPASFDFFQWVRLNSWPAGVAMTPYAVEHGVRQVSPRLRFRGELSPAFPGSEISAGRMRLPVRAAGMPAQVEALKRIDLYVTNFTLAGVLGPLPDSYTEWVRQQLGLRDTAMAEFLDIFNHRLSTLRYELKAASVPAFDALRPEYTRCAEAAGALMGLTAFEGEGARMLAQRVPMPRRALLALCGLAADGRRGLAQALIVLRIYLGMPLTIEPLHGAWRKIDPRDRSLLGRRRLRDTAPLGKRVWVNHAAVALALGPVSYERLCGLLPDRTRGAKTGLRFGRAYRNFAAMLHYLFDRQVDVVVTISVDEAAIPPPTLWRPRLLAGFGSHGLRLGQTAWLRGRPKAVRQVRFTIAADAVVEAA
ncbi:type VI secretion system baseplate subunit TssG [Dyella subtropica]|uniref:type VI secretion system baseplate subunit TssG n=1 Tax=Dyella subtropica TaxID=2992127 RepID=UPI0022538676|nr:type VI secretion system baseplate subunit TssG [Dyella subtropica]